MKIAETLQTAMRKVGKIKTAHGLRGEVSVLIFSKDISWFPKLKKFALSEADSPQDFYIAEKAKPFKDGLILKLEGVADRTQAESLRGKMFFIPENLLESEEGETIYLSEIENFEIHDPVGEEMGRIIGFSTNGAQDLLLVEKTKGGVAEIPFVEDFIVDIDFSGKVLLLDLPEGIWDLHAL